MINTKFSVKLWLLLLCTVKHEYCIITKLTMNLNSSGWNKILLFRTNVSQRIHQQVALHWNYVMINLAVVCPKFSRMSHLIFPHYNLKGWSMSFRFETCAFGSSCLSICQKCRAHSASDIIYSSLFSFKNAHRLSEPTPIFLPLLAIHIWSLLQIGN